MSIERFEVLEVRLAAYELALEWIQSEEYDSLNRAYWLHGTNIGNNDLGLCFFFFHTCGIVDIYSNMEHIFPELYANRFCQSGSYLAKNKEQRIEMLWKTVDEVKTELNKELEL